MKLTRIRSHPDFKLEGRSKHFQACWELELTPGEQTTRHQHYESEEIIYLVSGAGRVLVAEKERSLAPGELVLVPPRTDHVIANPSDQPLRAITVESSLDLGVSEEGDFDTGPAERAIQAEERALRSARSIDGVMDELPKQVDEAVAIKTIVDLFDIGGKLSEEIETTVGLDNPQGLEALTDIEKRIMRAVVSIASRYQQRGGRMGGFWG